MELEPSRAFPAVLSRRSPGLPLEPTMAFNASCCGGQQFLFGLVASCFRPELQAHEPLPAPLASAYLSIPGLRPVRPCGVPGARGGAYPCGIVPHFKASSPTSFTSNKRTSPSPHAVRTPPRGSRGIYLTRSFRVQPIHLVLSFQNVIPAFALRTSSAYRVPKGLASGNAGGSAGPRQDRPDRCVSELHSDLYQDL